MRTKVYGKLVVRTLAELPLEHTIKTRSSSFERFYLGEMD
jgi:hypothetical protein